MSAEPFPAPAEPVAVSDTPGPPGLGVLVFAGSVLGALWIAHIGATNYLIPAYRSQWVYAQTEATVLETDLKAGRHKGEERCRPRVRLSYVAHGQPREGWTYLNWAEQSMIRERAEGALRNYPVGGQVPAWYDPDQPSRVVVDRDVGFTMGWLMVCVGGFLPACVAGFMGLVFVALLFRARRDWFVLERTTGRVIAGEVREVPFPSGGSGFHSVVVVEYDHTATPRRAEVTGFDHLERGPAEAELAAVLLEHPIGEPCSLGYDPREREQPSLVPPLTLLGFAAEAVLILVGPVLAVPRAAYQFGGHLWQRITAPKAPGPERSIGYRLLMIAASLLLIGLVVRFVFRQDYECYFTFQTVQGKVLEVRAEDFPETGYEPRVRFCYVINDHYFERWTHPGWHSMRSWTQDEAEAALGEYPVGSEVTVWYNPDVPLMGILKRYARPHLYVLIVPPVVLLAVNLRALFRRRKEPEAVV